MVQRWKLDFHPSLLPFWGAQVSTEPGLFTVISFIYHRAEAKHKGRKLVECFWDLRPELELNF